MQKMQKKIEIDKKTYKPIKYLGDVDEVVDKLYKLIDYNTKNNYKIEILLNILTGYKKYKTLTIKQVELINNNFDRISKQVEDMVVITKREYNYMCSELDRMECEIRDYNIERNRL